MSDPAKLESVIMKEDISEANISAWKTHLVAKLMGREEEMLDAFEHCLFNTPVDGDKLTPKEMIYVLTSSECSPDFVENVKRATKQWLKTARTKNPSGHLAPLFWAECEYILEVF